MPATQTYDNPRTMEVPGGREQTMRSFADNDTPPADPPRKRRGAGVNHVTLVGRLAADPEVVATRVGSKTTMRLATNEREEAEFHPITLWGSLAQVAASHLRKGRLIYLEGRLHGSTWTDKQNNKHRTYEVLADTFQFLDGQGSEQAAA